MRHFVSQYAFNTMRVLTTQFSSSLTDTVQHPRILLVDDDDVLLDMLAEYLEAEGCRIAKANNGKVAIERIAEFDYDMVVLDIMMPELNGIEALKRIRTHHSVPVIMLTARGDDLDRIVGLELGADDYLPKPCNPRELYARIKAVLRRSNTAANDVATSTSIGDLSLDTGTRSVKIGDQNVLLTQTEFDLLWLLIGSPDQVVSKQDISIQVLDKPLSQWDRSIDVHISNLRKKLGKHKDGNERIRTLRGSGYLYVSPAAPQ